MTRLRQLDELVRDIERTRPGQSTEILLSRVRGQDLLDLIAGDRTDVVHNWQNYEAIPAVRISPARAVARRGLVSAGLLDAISKGRLQVPPRAMRIRDDSEYEQDPSLAENLFPDDVARNRRESL